MATKPSDRKARKPALVPQVAPRPSTKRSGQVGLLVMGTLAVGVTAYSLMPSESCERPPNATSPSLQQGQAECPPRGSSSSGSHGSSSSSRSSYYSSDSSSSHPSSSTSTDSSSAHVARGGFGAFAHAFTSHFSGGG